MQSLFPINLIPRWKQQAMEMKISSEDFFNRFFLLSLFRGMEQTELKGALKRVYPRYLGSLLLVPGCAAQMRGFDLYCDLYLGNLMDFFGSA